MCIYVATILVVSAFSLAAMEWTSISLNSLMALASSDISPEPPPREPEGEGGLGY